ncbi:MAG: hypothetical protein CUN55_06315 [Phototrophicales bacterium]|nr:MAG: hypothetical protein CUN55_06315 [Phototrophicales bacterium]
MAGFCVMITMIGLRAIGLKMKTKKRHSLFLSIVIFASMLSGWVFAQEDTPTPITAEDSTRLQTLTLLVQHTNTVAKIGFTPHGTAFYSAGFDGQYCVWNLNTQRDPLGTLYFCVADYLVGANSVAWSLDEKHLAITGNNGTSIRIFRVHAALPSDEWNIPIFTIPSPNQSVILSLFFTPNFLVAHDTNDIFTFYDAQNGTLVRKFEGIEATISPDGKRLALLDFSGRVILIDGLSAEVIDILPVDNVSLVAFSSDNRWIATADQNGIQWWEYTRQQYELFKELDRQVQYIAFSPDDRFIVTWEAKSVFLWERNSGTLAGEMPDHSGGINSVQFTPDMSRAVTLDSAGNGRIWRINESGEVERLLLMRDRVDRIYLSPDSVSAIAARIEFFARFYDIQRGQLRGQYTMPPDSEMSPDWTLMAIITNNVIALHGLPNDPRPLAFPPIAIAETAVNVRQTPSTEFARIAIIPENEPVFGTARTEDNQWIHVILEDGTQGWVFVSGNLRLNTPLENLPVMQIE